MDIRNRSAIRQAADRALAEAPGNPKRVVLVFAGASSLLALLVTLISFALSSQISNTGGLHNFGLRSMLSTGQSILPLVQMLLMLCWNMGYAVCALRMSRRQEAEPRTLLEGFRLFGPVFRATLLQGLIYFAVAFAAMYLSSFLFMMLPVSEDFYAAMEPLMGASASLDPEALLSDAALSALSSAMLPMFFIFLAVFCVAAVPITYQYRMVSFCLADSPKPGALAAMRESRAMMRRNRFALFRLDLCFWWYYLLQVLISMLCYGDLLLPMFGVLLPWSDTVSSFVFYGVSLAAQLALYCFALNRVQVTYATAYEALRPKPQENSVALGNIFNL